MKKTALLLAIIFSLFSFSGCTNNGLLGIPWPPKGSEPDDSGYDNSWPALAAANDSNFSAPNLIWQDEFNGNTLDLNKWRYDIGNGNNGWGNEEKQYYREQNVRVNGGKLQIMAMYEPDGVEGFKYTSGKILTDGKFSHKYGRFEARIRLPLGTGLWPAFWMMPQSSVYGGWPRSGELDIMEAMGRIDNRTSGAVHYGTANEYIQKRNYFANTIDEFHIYALEWTEGSIKMFADDFMFLEAEAKDWYSSEINGANGANAPFDQPFFIILNLAVGGQFDGGLLPSPKDLGALMEVDYVRVFSL